MSADLLLTFGQRLRAARIAAGMLQEDLARYVGRSRSSLANMEAGKQDPPLSVAAALARALRVPLGQLLGDGPPPGPAGDLAAAHRQLTAAVAGYTLALVPLIEQMTTVAEQLPALEAHR